MRRVALMMAAVFASSAAPALAQSDSDEASKWAQVAPTDDYDPANNKWNGLTTFVALARGMGIEMSLRSDLRWQELGKSDVLFVLYPTSLIVPRHVVSFIRGGGRVVIGDDFGRSERLFAELGLLRADAVGVGASSYYNDLAFAPMADAAGKHPLSEDAPQLATNHPSVFTELGFTKPVYRFGRSESVVSAGSLGSGRLVALADPSILINRMLQFDGNFGFAVNLLRYLSDAGSRRIVVVTGRFRLAGEPIENDRASKGFTGAVEAVNEWLGGLNEYVVTRSTARGLSILAGAGLTLLLLLIIPLRPKSELDGNWTRARPDVATAPSPEDIIALYENQGPRRQSFLIAASALRDGVAKRLTEELGYSAPFDDLPEHELYSEIDKKFGGAAVRNLRSIYRQLKALPVRSQAHQFEGRYISRQEFERLSDAATALYRSLEEKAV